MSTALERALTALSLGEQQPDYETARVTFNPAKPGIVPIRPFGLFQADGLGGGVLRYSVLVQKPGFRPKVVEKLVKKAPAVAGPLFDEDGRKVGTLRYL